MTSADCTYLSLFFVALVAATVPVGHLIAATVQDRIPAILRWLHPVERLIMRFAGVDPSVDMTWRQYAAALLAFHLVGGAALLTLQRMQAHLPLNPQGFGAVPLGVAVNTAVSFVTNTNWQAYSGEASMSYLTQMAGLGVQNFLSAATGIAVMAAVARGFVRKSAAGLGNFWSDLIRTTLYVLLPLSLALAVLLVADGVPMTFSPYARATTLDGAEQIVPLGPAASQIAIKQLGTNGGGFFGQNSAHPFENPTPLTNFLETVAILILPAGCVYAFGILVGARRHAWVLYSVMMVFFAASLAASLWAEFTPHPRLGAVAAMEGKELRFGIVPSVLWANATTVASNGSVNAMHSSLSPLAGGVSLFNILLGEIIFGGVGSGCYGMVAMIVLTVFLAGLMVGRTPEYLGKKIESFEVLMAGLAVLVPSTAVLLGGAWSCMQGGGEASAGNGGPHVLSEMLYAWASMCNNNGSAFAGLNATAGLYTWGGAVAMLIGRFAVILPLLALAGSVAAKKTVPPSNGTFAVDGWLFAILLGGTIIIVTALTHFPSMSLGPVLEQMLMQTGRCF